MLGRKLSVALVLVVGGAGGTLSGLSHADGNRLPTDPVTGATIYGTTSAVATETESETVGDSASAAPAMQRFPTDPVTGATIYPAEAEVATASDVAETNRLPSDPKTGATIYPDSAMPAAVASVTGTAAMTAGGDSERLPYDPVTGATVYPGDEHASAAVADPADNSLVAATEPEPELDPGRLPADPVTGATIYTAVAAEATETETTSLASGEAPDDAVEPAGNRLPFDPVTGATIYQSAPAESSGEDSQTTGSLEVAPKPAADTETAATDTDTAISPSAVLATTESTSPRIAFDPVTGASIHEVVAMAGTEDLTVDTATLLPGVATTLSEETIVKIAEMGNTDIDNNLNGISRQLGRVFGVTSSVMLTSTDEASATVALPRLVTASSSLDEVTDSFAALPDAAKHPLKKAIGSSLMRLTPLVDNTLGKEGVGPVLTPVIGPMMETLNGLTK